MLIPPKLSSRSDEGDCPSHWLAGDIFPWAGVLDEPEKGLWSLTLLWKKDRSDLEIYRETIINTMFLAIEQRFVTRGWKGILTGDMDFLAECVEFLICDL